MTYRTTLAAVIIFTGFTAAAFGNLGAEADLYVKAGNIFMEKSGKISSGPARNNLFQRARVCFERAIELYNLHLEKEPGDAAELMPLITELNSRRFWCNKSTTLVYNHASTPAPEKALTEAGLDPSMIEKARGGSEGPRLEDLIGEPEPLSPEEAKKLADRKKTAAFTRRIASYIKSRRIVEARFLCRRAIRKPSMGVPRDLAEQILQEIEYVERFLASVYLKADKLVGTHLRHEKLVNGRTAISGVITKIDRGKLHIQVMTRKSDSDAGLSIGVPLLNFNDLFLVRNISTRSKPVLTGVGSFYMLQGNSARAGKVFDSIRSMKGDPADLAPFVSRSKSMAKLNRFTASEKDTEKTTALIRKETATAVRFYKAELYDRALRSISRIMKASKYRLEYLVPVSKQVKEDTGKYLPEFVQALVHGCPKCKGTRQMMCPNCRGTGRIKVSMSTYRWCPLCKGEGKVPCTYCRKRLKNKTYLGYITKLRELFKRDEDLDTDTAHTGPNTKSGPSSEGKHDTEPGSYKKPGSVAAGGLSFKRKDGNLTITGKVHNGTAQRVKNVIVTIALLGKDSKPVFTGKEEINGIMAPDAEALFTIRIEKAPAFTSYSYRLAYRKAAD